MFTIETTLTAKRANAIIEKSASLLSNKKAEIKAANAAYNSLSQVLKDMQRACTDYRPILGELGHSRVLTPAELRACAHKVGLVKEDKQGNEQIAFVRKSVRRDEATGAFILDAAGEKTYTYDLAIVKTWTPSKVLKVLAQCTALSLVQAEEEAAKKESKKSK
jgi:hypothetical protein